MIVFLRTRLGKILIWQKFLKHESPTLSYYFKIGKATACGMIEEVCEAIWIALQDYVRSLRFRKKMEHASLHTSN